MPEPPAEYTQCVTNLKAFRSKVLSDLVGSRLVAGLDANHDSMVKYKGLVESLSIVPYAFARVRESALALRLKGLDVGAGELRKIVAGYEGMESNYPLNPPFAVPQRKLPQVDVFLYQYVKDLDLLKTTDVSALQSVILIQVPSDTFQEPPDAENSFYDYYQLYVQSRRRSEFTLQYPKTGFEDWKGIKGVDTHLFRQLTPVKETDYKWYHLFLLMDSAVYSDVALQETPAVIVQHPKPVGDRPLVTINIAGQGIRSTMYGVFGSPATTEKPTWLGFQQIAENWTWTVQDGLWVNSFIVTISVSPIGGGTTNPAVGQHERQAETDIQITATPSGGYMFDHWEVDGANKGTVNPITITVRKDITVVAIFVPT